MASAYFAPLVALPDVITGPGFYITRTGERVTVWHASKRHAFECYGVYDCGERCDHWHKSGRLYANTESDNDIVSKA